MTNINVEFSCKPTADSDAVDYAIELDLSDITQEDWDEFALRSIIISAQASIRAYEKTDKSKPSPVKDNKFKVNKPGTRSQADPEKTKAAIMKQLKKLSPAEMADLLARLG